MNVFQLGRMRHLDLLALYFQLNPGTEDKHAGLRIGRVPPAHMPKDRLAALILDSLRT